MERYFKFDKFNTFTDWDLILTAKDVTPPEPKIYKVDIDGMDGTLDLSEALSGQVVYKDRTVSAKFWTDHGTRADRNYLLRRIRQAIHGKKVRIVEPDDPDHYLFVKKIKQLYVEFYKSKNIEKFRNTKISIERKAVA